MSHRPTTRPEAAFEAYAGHLFREVVRILARRRPEADIDDIASAAVERFLGTAEAIMAQYPDPARYARLVARRAGITFDRHERAQRGEGVRLSESTGGLLGPRRTVMSGNRPVTDGGPELFDVLGDSGVDADDAVASSVARHCDDVAVLAQCLAGVPVVDRRLLLLVDGMGHTVNEVAEVIGQRRETVSRRLNRTRRAVQRNGAALTLSPSG